MKISTPVRALIAVLFVVGVVVGAVALSHLSSAPGLPEPSDSGASIAPEGPRESPMARRVGHQQALQILAGWDAERAAAYASGDVRALTALYLPGSRIGRVDVRVLREYVERGLKVEGMRMQILAVRVLRHDRGRLVVRVTDRLVGAVAIGRQHRVALPVDRADRRLVSLVRSGGRWLVEGVR